MNPSGERSGDAVRIRNSATYGGIPGSWQGRHDPPGSLPERVHRRLREKLASWLSALPAGSRVLDLGCGRGDLGRRLSERAPCLKVFGLDLSEDMIREAGRSLPKGAGDLVLAEGSCLPFRDRSFDAVVILDLITHFNGEREAPRLLAEAARVCSGWILVEVKNPLTLGLLRGLRRWAGTLSNAAPLRFFLGWDNEPQGLSIHVHRPGKLLAGFQIQSRIHPWPLFPAPDSVYVLKVPA